MNLTHAHILINSERIEKPLDPISVGLFGSAYVAVSGIPDNVTAPKLVIVTPKHSTFAVDIKTGGLTRIEPGMLDAEGNGTYYVMAKDPSGTDTPLGYGALIVNSFPLAAQAQTSVLPVSAVLDTDGNSRQLIAVKDDTGTWTLAVGDLVDMPSQTVIDQTALPDELGAGDTLGKVKEAVNKLRKAVTTTCIAFALVFGAQGARLDDIAGTNDVVTLGEISAAASAAEDTSYATACAATGAAGVFAAIFTALAALKRRKVQVLRETSEDGVYEALDVVDVDSAAAADIDDLADGASLNTVAAKVNEIIGVMKGSE